MCVQQCGRGRGWRLRARRRRPRRCPLQRSKAEATVLLGGAMSGGLVPLAPTIARLCMRCLGSLWGAGRRSTGAAVVVGPPPLTAAGGGGCETHAAARQVSAPEPSARHLRPGMASQLDSWTGGAAQHSRQGTHTGHSQRAPLPLPLRAFPAARGGRHRPGGGGGGSCLNGGLWRERPQRQCCWEHTQRAAMGSVNSLASIQTFPPDLRHSPP